MKLFIDTANIDDIREANLLGVIDGVTTNPTLVSKEGKDFISIIKEICQIVDGPISVEAVSTDSAGMLKEARENTESMAIDVHRIGDNDEQVWVHCLISQIHDERASSRPGSVPLVEVIISDITERAVREKRTRFEADHDALTKLKNRLSGEVIMVT